MSNIVSTNMQATKTPERHRKSSQKITSLLSTIYWLSMITSIDTMIFIVDHVILEGKNKT